MNDKYGLLDLRKIFNQIKPTDSPEELKKFEKLEKFFNSIPKLSKKIDMTCSKCGFEHHLEVQGLESFFG